MNVRSRLCLFVLVAALLGACNDAPPVAATVGELCTLDPGAVVIVEGQLSLPLALRCQEGKCRLNFGDGTDGISVEMRASEEPRSSMLKLPPNQYSADDLLVVLNDGTTADRTTRVAVTGRVRRPSANDCHLAVSSVKLPD